MIISAIAPILLFNPAPQCDTMTMDEQIQARKEYIAARQDAVQEAPPPDVVPATSPEPEPIVEAPEPAPAMSVNWDVLAECESHGEWDYGPHSGWGSGIFEGGLQFHPNTWDGYKPAGYPEAAYQASRAQQIVVAEKVLAEQGLGAWPACTRKLGWR